ncbi:MAG: hypothetical protein Q8R76_11100 [Candidatus Omnitrophota bacterium]|nr:hypothetical protein [Candidatus Omnitrophota bacterium]
MTAKRSSTSKKKMRRISRVITALLVLAGVAAGVLMWKASFGKYPWLLNYVRHQVTPNATHAVAGTKHVMFTFVDHFEPKTLETVELWAEDYRNMAYKHLDADGNPPKHTWFWYFDKVETENKRKFLKVLSELAYENLGEIEIHMHHYNDNEESFTKLMREAIALSQEWGALITAEVTPRTAFGFIHGLWSLDNSRGRGACGVTNELIVLRKLGCYADYTHPSWGAMHPDIVNKLYYATDDPAESKSYAGGTEMAVERPGIGDLLIFNGPSVVRFKGLKPVYDHNDVTMADLPTKDRVDDWVKTGIHVKGRPEWIFVKVHTHGAVAGDREAVLGAWRNRMHTHLEEKYNDSKNFRLHYVTAREAYNIAKAAEAGKKGDPNQYRDFVIPKYVNSYVMASVPFEAISFRREQFVLRFAAKAGAIVKVRVRNAEVDVSGDAAVKSREVTANETILELVLQGEGVVGFKMAAKP